MSDEPVSKRDLLMLGVRKIRQTGAMAAEAALDNVANRITPQVQRPPGAIPELQFLVACTRCGACSQACPVQAVLTLDGNAGVAAGTPFLDANDRKPCIACKDTPCMSACPTGALRKIPIGDAVLGLAEINRDICRPWTGGGACQRCVTTCPFTGDAILADEQGRPFVDPRRCIGCGLCRAACPTHPKAIRIRPPSRF